jgi:uncharacterized protein YabN with tetrapyrrole methylase and pyrophosphatase domain
MSDASTRRGVDVYLVGLGIKGVWHLTREAEAALTASTSVLYVDSGFGIAEYLESLGTRPVSLIGEYREGRNRAETYVEMAARVVEAALDDPPVSFATYGHPGFLVYPTALVRAAAEALGLSARVVAGISSLDTLLIDLGVDPGSDGLQLHEATAMLVHERPVDPEVPLVVMQLETLESAYYTTARSRPDRFQPFQRYLERFYPSDHVVTAVLSASFPLFEPRLSDFPLGALAERYAAGSALGTLFVPPVNRAPTRNAELAAKVFATEHLRRITS